MQVEDGKGEFTAHEGGSDKGKLIASMTGNQNGALISIPGNQMFVVFHTNGEIAKTCIFARIMESKYQITCNCSIQYFILENPQNKCLDFSTPQILDVSIG